MVAAAATAPAYAASTCANPRLYTLDWGATATAYSHPNATPNSSVATCLSSNGGTPIYAHFETVFRGVGAGDGTLPSGEARNLSVPSATAGADTNRDPAITNLGGLGAGERGVRLQQTSVAGYTNRQDLTVTFRSGAAATSPIVDIQALTFSVVDIDNLATPAYSDRVAVTSTAAYGQTRDTNIIGAGTSVAETSATVGPWRNSAAGNQNENAAGARVRVSWTDDNSTRMSQFTLSYWTNAGTGQYHRIYLSDFAFRVCP